MEEEVGMPLPQSVSPWHCPLKGTYYLILKCTKGERGLPWWSSDQDSVLPLQEAWAGSLVGEVRSHMLHSAAKEKVYRG